MVHIALCINAVRLSVFSLSFSGLGYESDRTRVVSEGPVEMLCRMLPTLGVICELQQRWVLNFFKLDYAQILIREQFD